MFSKELAIMDRNTVQYMIEEQQAMLEEERKRAEIERKKAGEERCPAKESLQKKMK